MPLYFFNVYNGDVTIDDEGETFADDAAARSYAVHAARALAAETVSQGHLVLDHCIRIENEDRTVMSEVTFGEVVEVR